jgi:hypothetical protein
MSNDAEKRWHDPKALRAAMVYAATVVALAVIAFAVYAFRAAMTLGGRLPRPACSSLSPSAPSSRHIATGGPIGRGPSGKGPVGSY